MTLVLTCGAGTRRVALVLAFVSWSEVDVALVFVRGGDVCAEGGEDRT